MRGDPRQMAPDPFPEERPERRSPLGRMMGDLVARGRGEGRIRPLTEELLCKFGNVDGTERACRLACLYGAGRHAIPRLRACPPALIGPYDESLDCHTVWDRRRAARWIPLQEAFEAMERHCGYREPCTGAPVRAWHIDSKWREAKRPYEG